MRDIKFRAWNKVWKCMYYLTGFRLVGKKHIQLYYLDIDGDPSSCTVLLENIELMQYTGIHDCKRTEEFPNGQEIYEGDIIVFDDKKLLDIVKFKDGSYMAKQNGAFGSYIGQGYCDWTMYAEVIGNIYENPELLKESE